MEHWQQSTESTNMNSSQGTEENLRRVNKQMEDFLQWDRELQERLDALEFSRDDHWTIEDWIEGGAAYAVNEGNQTSESTEMETAPTDTSLVAPDHNEEMDTKMEVESVEKAVVRLPITTSSSLIREIEIVWKEWEATYQYQSIKWALLRCNLLVTNAVAFELGSPITYPGVTEHLILQHCLLLAVCDSLGVPLRTNLACVSQSRSYTEEDCQALYQFGIQACTEFGGFLRIDRNSVVVSMYPDVVVQELAMNFVRPAVIICVDTETRDPRVWRGVNKMLKNEYERVPLSQGKFPKEFALYIRLSP